MLRFLFQARTKDDPLSYEWEWENSWQCPGEVRAKRGNFVRRFALTWQRSRGKVGKFYGKISWQRTTLLLALLNPFSSSHTASSASEWRKKFCKSVVDIQLVEAECFTWALANVRKSKFFNTRQKWAKNKGLQNTQKGYFTGKKYKRNVEKWNTKLLLSLWVCSSFKQMCGKILLFTWAHTKYTREREN